MRDYQPISDWAPNTSIPAIEGAWVEVIYPYNGDPEYQFGQVKRIPGNLSKWQLHTPTRGICTIRTSRPKTSTARDNEPWAYTNWRYVSEVPAKKLKFDEEEATRYSVPTFPTRSNTFTYAFSPSDTVGAGSQITLTYPGPKENQDMFTIRITRVIDGTVGQIVSTDNNKIVWQSEPFQDRPKTDTEEAANAEYLATEAAKSKRDQVLADLFK